MSEENEVALANAIRRKIEIGEALALLGSDNQKDFGKSLVDSGHKAATRNQRKSEFDQRKNSPVHLGEGFMFHPETGEAIQDPNYAAYADKKHQRQVDMYDAAEQRRIAREQRKQDQVSSTDRRKLAEVETNLNAGKQIVSSLATTDAGVFNRAEDLASAGIKSVSPGLGNLFEGEFKTPEEQKILGQMRWFVAEVRKEKLGSAISSIEAALGAGWDPTAAGITKSEAMRRMDTLVEFLENEYATTLGGRTLSSQPQPTPTPEQTQSAPAEVWSIDQNGNPVRVQ